ncbi:Regulator of protease activity HflC, stomatin/prohibitin superfamily [Micromonospora viridifaciens]|uniref:Regulator of protease activity HflC, stomatin/prohibitin superfamily n=1 Tax=Micromonospora viridifaciens TaxID=1881 RepID=A0A1C4Z2U8_MICVI|nr:SPFH domain-containing protein [Micromonospora viridifaciens]SCF26921.1 Regulator of protease activity HflC, stomatin/prohibitin superfamily [Micromonospora viridifaciens]
MPSGFTLAIVTALAALVAVAVALLSPRRNVRQPSFLAAAAALVVTLLLTVTTSAHSVPIRSVGIVTSFGKPTGKVTGSGLKWVAPWQRVGEWDAGRQKYDHIGSNNCVRVRTGTLADACVEVLVEWQVQPDNAPKQFMDYKGDFDSFRGQRVGVQLDSAVNDAFSTYNPLERIDAKTGSLNVDLKPFAENIKSNAERRLAEDVDILSVTITRVNHDEKTEGNIKAFQDKLAQTRNLEQDRRNAEIQKQITETNAKVDKVTRCLEIAEKNGSTPGLCINPGIVTGTAK